VTKVAEGTRPAPAPTTTASEPYDPAAVPPTEGGPDAAVREDVGVAEPPAAPPTPERTPGVPHPAEG
jgi:hypothetical protein